MIGTYDFKKIEAEIRQYWRKIELLKLIQKKNEKGDPYFLLDGPPYANNVPHVGHIRNTVYKDFYIRLAGLKGDNILFQPGFDTHGLPIENMVEKKLNLKSKKDIETLGIKKFCDICKENATNFKDDWLRVYEKMGSWYSWKEPYLTYKNEYIESVWWGFKQLWDKGMVYEGKKPVFWCPKCETALAGYEATDKYKDVQDPLIIVKFKVKNTKNDYLLVFTTTPWTLPSNVAVLAKADEDYVKLETEKGNLILAKNLISLMDEIKLKYKLLEEFKGQKLDGLEYEPVIELPTQEELKKNPVAQKVYMSIPILKERVASKIQSKKGVTSKDLFEHFVSVNEGTGLVHCAPGHGKTDNLVGKHYKLPEISPLDDQCRFTDMAGKYKGRFVKEADQDILEELDSTGNLLYHAKLKHSYPHCWRCVSPLIFRMSNQWFLKVDSIKEKMLEANEGVEWQPDFAKERFGSWVANADDWNFSRQRYWGIPIPIWKSETGELKIIGSKEELEKASGKNLDKNFDLHTISEIKLKAKDGTEMKTIGDIFDVWFDSGSAPNAAFHYPFENKEIFEKHYPVNRINESQDQTRGWFYSLMFCGMGVFDKVPYKTVSMPGWVVDKNGEKMSKSLNNFVAAEDAMDSLGADNVRFYYCWDVDPGSLSKFNEETVKMEASKIHNMLWNLHKYLVTQSYAEKAQSKSFELKDLKDITLEMEDTWVLSKLNSTIVQVIESYDSFKLHNAGRTLYDFVINDISRTYIQLIRERLEEDSRPLSVLFHVLINTIKLLAPISPHITDVIYNNLKTELKTELKFYNFLDSIHLELIPGKNEKELEICKNKIDDELETNFEIVMSVIGAILASRDKVQIGIRWPVKEAIIDTTKDMQKIINKLQPIIINSTNAKSITLKKVDVKIDFKPRYKEIGAEYGEKTGDVISCIMSNKEKVILALKEEKEEFVIEPFKLKKSFFEVLKTAPKGFSMGEFKYGLAFINSTLDKEMEPEGFTREVIRRIQVLRKDMNLLKQDHISLGITGDEELLGFLKQFETQIKDKVGAKELVIGQTIDSPTKESEEKVKSKKFKICVKKI